MAQWNAYVCKDKNIWKINKLQWVLNSNLQNFVFKQQIFCIQQWSCLYLFFISFVFCFLKNCYKWFLHRYERYTFIMAHFRLDFGYFWSSQLDRLALFTQSSFNFIRNLVFQCIYKSTHYHAIIDGFVVQQTIFVYLAKIINIHQDTIKPCTDVSVISNGCAF